MSDRILETLADKVDPNHTALVVVDVQNDFCASDGAFGRKGYDLGAIQRMAPRLAGFIDRARSAGCRIVFVRGRYDAIYQSPNWIERRSRLSRATVCLSDTPGFDYYLVRPEPEDAEVFKHRYSAFLDTDLDLILRSQGVRTIVVTGVTTNVCVESTAREGAMRGYYVVLVSDCTATNDLHLHDATLENIGRYFGVVHEAAELDGVWLGQQAETRAAVAAAI